MIVQNPNVPQPQAVQLDQQPQIEFGNGAGPQHDPGSQLEPEKEKNSQHELEPEAEPEGEFVDRTAF